MCRYLCVDVYVVRLFVVDDLCHQYSLRGKLVADKSFCLHNYDSSSNGFGQPQFELQRIAGNDLVTEFNAVYLEEVGRIVLRIGHAAQCEDSTALGHGLDDQDAGHNRFVGEVSHEEGLVHRDVFDSHDILAVQMDILSTSRNGGGAEGASGFC